MASVLLGAMLSLPAGGWQEPVGEQAPEFSLQDLSGRQVALKSLRGRIVVMHFWATYWTECFGDMERLEKLGREFKDDSVVVLGVNVGQLPRVVREFVRRRHLTYPQLVNARGELILQYNATDAPTVVIVGKDGRILERLREEQGEERLRAALTKAIGR